jgi:ketosteroid isomerase-like protein
MDETYVHPPEFDTELMIADGEHVVAIGRITLTDATGKRTTSDYSDAWRLRDGKLAELRAFVVEADIHGVGGQGDGPGPYSPRQPAQVSDA